MVDETSYEFPLAQVRVKREFRAPDEPGDVEKVPVPPKRTKKDVADWVTKSRGWPKKNKDAVLKLAITPLLQRVISGSGGMEMTSEGTNTAPRLVISYSGIYREHMEEPALFLKSISCCGARERTSPAEHDYCFDDDVRVYTSKTGFFSLRQIEKVLVKLCPEMLQGHVRQGLRSHWFHGGFVSHLHQVAMFHQNGSRRPPLGFSPRSFHHAIARNALSPPTLQHTRLLPHSHLEEITS
jgi:hypothetical protein